MAVRRDELMELAARLWTAAETLDAIHGGGDKVWAWTHRKVAELTRQGKQEDPEAVAELVRLVEERLEMERARIREEEEAEARSRLRSKSSGCGSWPISLLSGSS